MRAGTTVRYRETPSIAAAQPRGGGGHSKPTTSARSPRGGRGGALVRSASITAAYWFTDSAGFANRP